MSEMRCSSEGCSELATTALAINGQPGHVHDCNSHTALLREWCDVTSSAALTGDCPWPCTDQPIAVDQPKPLA